MKKTPTMWHFARQLAEYCMDCDGCGWVEGGKTIKTNCHRCKGVGLIWSYRSMERTSAF